MEIVIGRPEPTFIRSTIRWSPAIAFHRDGHEISESILPLLLISRSKSLLYPIKARYMIQKKRPKENIHTDISSLVIYRAGRYCRKWPYHPSVLKMPG